MRRLLGTFAFLMTTATVAAAAPQEEFVGRAAGNVALHPTQVRGASWTADMTSDQAVVGIDDHSINIESVAEPVSTPVIRQGTRRFKMTAPRNDPTIAAWVQRMGFLAARNIQVSDARVKGSGMLSKDHSSIAGTLKVLVTGTDAATGAATRGLIRIRMDGSRTQPLTPGCYHAMTGPDGVASFVMGDGRSVRVAVQDQETGAPVVNADSTLVTNGTQALTLQAAPGYVPGLTGIRAVALPSISVKAAGKRAKGQQTVATPIMTTLCPAGGCLDRVQSGIEVTEFAGDLRNVLLGDNGLTLLASNLTKDEVSSQVASLAAEQTLNGRGTNVARLVNLGPADSAGGSSFAYSTFANTSSWAGGPSVSSAPLLYPNDAATRFNLSVDHAAGASMFFVQPTNAPASAIGTGNGVISGQVSLSGVASPPGVTMRLYPRGGTYPVQSARLSVNDGYYAFNQVPVGDYFVLASRTGDTGAMAKVGVLGSQTGYMGATAEVNWPNSPIANMRLETAASVRPVLLGIDVSHYQGTIDWTRVKLAGKAFALVKASEGMHTQDDYVGMNVAGAKAAGLVTGTYHLAHPDLDTAADEAQFFVSQAGAYVGSGFLPPVLDIESTYGMSGSRLSQWIKAWSQDVQQLTGVTPAVHANRSVLVTLDADIQASPLWIATDSGDSIGTSLDRTWPGWRFQQYVLDTGSCWGVTGSVDLDSFNGTLDELNSLAR